MAEAADDRDPSEGEPTGPGTWLRRWSLTRTLPLGVAIGMFAVALVTTQVGLRLLEARDVATLEAKASLFLDAIADTAGRLLDQGAAAVEARLQDKLLVQEAVAEQMLALSWTATADGETGGSVVLGEQALPAPQLAELLQRAATPPTGELAFVLDSERNRALAAKAYPVEGGVLSIAAALDTSEISAASDRAQRWALIIDLVLAAVAAALTYALTRRALAPLDHLARELTAETASAPATLANGRKGEVGRLEDAVKTRLDAEAARNLALRDIGEKERNALLAKLAAGLAHEVRNPLAGLLNGVSTLRRFGEDAAVRAETLDLVERGLRSIGRVADTMLTTYRPDAGRMGFTADDLHDLRLLIAPEARRRNITVEWPSAPLAAIAVDADALRQILLNLLLNACKACDEGGHLSFGASQDSDATVFTISDSGPGMPDSVLAFLVDGARLAPMVDHKGLGLWMVTRLLEDIGGRIKVESRSGDGTVVAVRLPIGTAASAGDDALTKGAA